MARLRHLSGWHAGRTGATLCSCMQVCFHCMPNTTGPFPRHSCSEFQPVLKTLMLIDGGTCSSASKHCQHCSACRATAASHDLPRVARARPLHVLHADMQPQLWKAHWLCGRVTCFGRFGTSAAAAAETCILQSPFRVVLCRRSTHTGPWPTDAQPVWPKVLCRNGLPCPRSSALMAL